MFIIAILAIVVCILLYPVLSFCYRYCYCRKSEKVVPVDIELASEPVDSEVFEKDQTRSEFEKMNDHF